VTAEPSESSGGTDHGAGGEPADEGDGLRADERALLAAFERRSPQGSLQWGFDDAMRRIEHPDIDSAAGAAPWKGLPDDLWERGRTAQIGQRFVGDVAGVLADILAADARAAADAAVEAVNGDRFVAAWDALRFLAARVERLEARVDPLGLETAEWPVPVPDAGEWVAVVERWLAPSDSRAPVVVGESGDGALAFALGAAGRRVVGVEPRGASAWRSLTATEMGEGRTVEFVLADVLDHLKTIGADRVAGVVLLGCVDRLDLAGKLALVDEAFRVVEPGGTVVVLATDQSAWSEGLSIPARDLLPAGPLHPETWSFLLHRSGAGDTVWHRPGSGTLHAVVARLEP
jgi:SAM-dependent methyltransferase